MSETCYIYYISNMYDFDLFFGWSTSDHVCQGVVTGTWQTHGKHMFYNIIYHIFEGGGGISFENIPIP